MPGLKIKDVRALGPLGGRVRQDRISISSAEQGAASVFGTSGTFTMGFGDQFLQFLKPGTADRTVLLPPEHPGLAFMIINTNGPSDTNQLLIVQEDSGTTTIVTIAKQEVAIVACDGTTWHAMVARQFIGSKGADVASGDELDLGVDGTYFDITGTTTINHIKKTGGDGRGLVTLQFDASVTVTHNAASPSGSEASILLSGAANFSATANDTLTLHYDGTTFREVARTVI